MSDPKEPAYWSTDYKSPLFLSTDEQYAQCFKGYRGEKYVGESTTCYLSSTCAAENISNRIPSAKIIAILRNPVDMVPALHAQYLKMGLESVPSLDEALKSEEQRIRGEGLPKLWPFPSEFLQYRSIATYSPQIQRYQMKFNSSNFMVILFDDLSNRTPEVLNRVCEFLGVSKEFSPKLRKHNETFIPRYLPLQMMAMRFCQTSLPRPLQRSVHLRIYFEKLKVATYNLISKYNLKKPAQLQSLASRDRLKRYFMPEIDNLERCLGRSLDCWR